MTSFSAMTKDALSVLPVKTAHCRRAELSAIAAGIGLVDFDEEDRLLFILQSESLPVMTRADYLLRMLAGAAPEISVIRGAGVRAPLFSLLMRPPEKVDRVLRAAGFLTAKGVLRELSAPAPKALYENECCKRAFLRGAFLASGYVRDPNADYHAELLARSEARAEELKSLLASFSLPARITHRKGASVVYLKEAEAVSDFLSVIGAAKSRLEMENIRILRGIQGDVNRRVNCETANLKKTADAGMDQVRAIEKLDKQRGLKSLPEQLREIAEARLEHPDASLAELGTFLDPPLGKSGVNHRLRKLMEIADTVSSDNDIVLGKDKK